jgi:hypothetical protein
MRKYPGPTGYKFMILLKEGQELATFHTIQDAKHFAQQWANDHRVQFN